MGRDGRFPLDLTPDELAFGFDVIESRAGIFAVVTPLRPGLHAVKMRGPDGTTEYAVCDEHLHPVYVAAKTLDELRERFARGRYG